MRDSSDHRILVVLLHLHILVLDDRAQVLEQQHVGVLELVEYGFATDLKRHSLAAASLVRTVRHHHTAGVHAHVV